MIRNLVFLLSLSTALVGQAAVPAGYRFASLEDAAVAADSAGYGAGYARGHLSAVTAVNNNGHLFGFRRQPEGTLGAFSLAFASNPKMTAVDTPDLIALAAGDSRCWWFFCTTEAAWGIRLQEDGTAVSAFLTTVLGTTPIAGSLPYALFPGNFVEENRHGIVASTQAGIDSQYGALLHPGGVTLLEDVPWLAGINDLADPLVLGYDGTDGDCQVFGEGCIPLPETCEADGSDTHRNTTGRGHESHGRGHGYGHYKCRSDDTSSAVPAVIDPARGALLLRLSTADYTVARHRFPTVAAAGDRLLPVAGAFPLAINDQRAILRADLLVDGTWQDKRLLSCRFDPAALDADADGIVDCIGGLTVIGGLDASVRVGTVIGFSLNNAGTLAGNLGYSAAGIASPFVLDADAEAAQAVLLSGLAPGTGEWELHAVTDINQNGRLVGYGFQACSAVPQGYFLDPVATAPAAGLRFARGAFEQPAWVAPGGTVRVAPTVTGGTGALEYRVHIRSPDDEAWTLLGDWSAEPPTYEAGDAEGDVCFRIEVRDTAAPDTVAQTLVRYRVAAAPVESGGDGTTDSDDGTVVDTGVDDWFGPLVPASGDGLTIGDLLAAPGLVALWLLALLSLRRRRC